MRRLLGLFCIAAAGCTGLVGEPNDAGLVVKVDEGLVDGGGVDAGEPPDAGDDAGIDAGPEDAGIDAGPADAGPAIGLDSRPVNSTCIAPAPPPNTSGVTTLRVFPALAFNQPLGLFNPPGDSTRVWVQERAGVIRSFPNQNDAGVGSLTTVLDIDARVNDVGEGGFLGMAFHPRWPSVREVFVSYTETASPLRTVISRFKSLDSGATLSPASEEKIFTLDQPQPNHKGGNISFGPDGFLYIGLGDGGGGGDPLGAGQRLNTNLGKFLRIDVNVPFAQRYAIPPSNPYAADNTPCNRTSSTTLAATGVRCAEIYASGLRNPWRWSFDTASGELWCADVGQNAWEEIDRIVLGGNYGWNTREGAHCYNPANNCQTAGLIDPVVEYPHAAATGMSGNSVTGGFVYRGTTIPTLVGKFVFGDFGSGKIAAV